MIHVTVICNQCARARIIPTAGAALPSDWKPMRALSDGHLCPECAPRASPRAEDVAHHPDNKPPAP